MLDIVLARFDAPMMSFGAPIVDNYGFIQEFPAKSMIAGLIANALGYDHSQTDLIQSLQENISCASRCDRRGERIIDYQTVELGQGFMTNTGWTTRGAVEGRAGARDTREGVHIRYRHYWVDSIYTLAITLNNPELKPDIKDIERALQEPARPLFIGRKSCIPSAPIFLKSLRSNSLLEALCSAPTVKGDRKAAKNGDTVQGFWPDEGGMHSLDYARLIAVYDERDWKNQIHCGRRLIYHGYIRIEETKE